MSLATLLTRPVVVVTRTRTEGGGTYGEDVLVDDQRLDVLAHVHQQTTDELLSEQDTTRAGWVAYFAPTVPIDRDCVVEVAGARFEVVGEPYRVRQPPLARDHHVEVQLREVVG